ncbi:efflux RND transporter permease subunit [Anoxynatronum buryatiense]|uniref:Multidrug efflux pump subunit AcrB n=1 Tax=Anoxynatronum buryatiense TaxID=489973 RepID=A0AA45WX55_9CLOT|nr:efflux RND transporter permease subunit [Anoxynatronum buryatiense]SMP61920.1 Multidrug efflux pump subunit AcrB [Anoxynatronum buryatiense]
MTRLIQSVLRHPLVVFLLAGMVVLAGALSFYMSPKQEYPEIAPPMALVTTVYPGALPEDVERLVTRKIEEEVEAVTGHLRSNSRSVHGLSVVVLELEYGTSVDNAWVDLRNRMSDLQKDLPDEAFAIEINTKLDETAGFILAVTGPDLTMAELGSLASEIKTSMEGIAGLTRISLTGEQASHLEIRVDAEALLPLPLTMSQINDLIHAQTAAIPLGEMQPQFQGDQVRVNLAQGMTSQAEVEQLVLLASSQSGATLRLGQLAAIRRRTKPEEPRIWHQDETAVLITGYFTEGSNVLFTGRRVQQELAAFENRLPQGAALSFLLFQPDDIAEKVNGFALNLLQGILFVSLVIFIGMGIRNALVVSCAIPLSIFMTLLFMYLLKIPVHQISIAALIIALGMLVDNAIVVSDAIQVRLDEGQSATEAGAGGARDVAVPVFTSTLTTIGAFLPLLMLDSLAGDFIRSVPQIVIMALAASYLVSVFFIPVAAARFFRSRIPSPEKNRARQRIHRLVETGIRRPRASLMVLGVLVITAAIMGLQLGLQFFPKADTDLVYIDIKTENDQGIEATSRLAEDAASLLAAWPEVTQYSVAVGDGFPKFYNTLPIPLQARDTAQIVFRVNLKDSGRYRRLSQFTDDLQREMDRQLVEGQATVKLLEQADPIAAPVLVRISGGTLEERQQASRQLRRWLEEIPGTLNVRDDDAPARYEYRIQPVDDVAMRLGITRYQLARELSLAIMGQAVATVTLDGQETVLFLTSTANSREAIENMGILSPVTGEKTPLKQVAVMEAVSQPASVLKYNSQETITVMSDVVSGYNAVNIQDQLQAMAENQPAPGVRMTFAGEKEEIAKYFGEVGVSGVFAVMIVFVILVLQFGNLRLPLLILLTIPFATIGSLMGLWLFQQPLSFTALLGMVSLFGIVVNNAIILLDYIQYEVRQGYDPPTACRQAVALRLRPILLTTITTVMGLLPLILSGSDLFTPLAIALMAGLLGSTFLTLVILPVLYLITYPKTSAAKGILAPERVSKE